MITLTVYSLILTIAYLITDNEDVVITFGLGIVGLSISAISRIIYKIRNLFKHYIGKRSIFEEESSGKKYKCRTSNTNDIQWVAGYKLIKRYASKSEWEDIPDFDKVFIENSKRNCNHCKYNKKCNDLYRHYDDIRCKHDKYGEILEFDKFENK